VGISGLVSPPTQFNESAARSASLKVDIEGIRGELDPVLQHGALPKGGSVCHRGARDTGRPDCVTCKRALVGLCVRVTQLLRLWFLPREQMRIWPLGCAGLSVAQRGEWTASSEFSGIRVRSRPSGQRPSDFVIAPKPFGRSRPISTDSGRQLRNFLSCFTTAGLVPNPVVGEVLQFCSGSAGTRRSPTRQRTITRWELLPPLECLESASQARARNRA
jgi:hypothetical protein